MKTLKKSLCIVLSFLMVFSTIVFFNPLKADASNIPEFAYGDYYYYPEGTRFISDLKLVQGEYVISGFASNKADRKAVSDNTKAQLINLGYTIVGSADIGDGTAQMTANLTQRKDAPKNWRIFTFLGYKTTTDITQAVTSIRARHEDNTSYSWYVDGIRYNIIDSYDLNQGNGGDYIYLYASNDPAAGLPITSIRISNTNDNINATSWAGKDQLVLDGNGNISDLNNGAADTTWIYMAYGNSGVFQKISQSVVKDLYDQIVRAFNIERRTSDTDEKLIDAANIYNSFDNSYKAGTYTETQIKAATTALKSAIENPSQNTPKYPSGYDFTWDRYYFSNLDETISKDIYKKAFGNIKGSWLHFVYEDGDNHGHCYGMTSTSTVLLKYPTAISYFKSAYIDDFYAENMFNINPEDQSDLFGEDLRTYIKYGYVYQFDSDVQQSEKASKNNLKGLYNSVKSYVNGSNNPVIINVYHNALIGRKDGHSVLAIGLQETTDYYIILINDSNIPYEQQQLKINKNFSSWEYSVDGVYNYSSSNGHFTYSFPANVMYNVGLLLNENKEQFLSATDSVLASTGKISTDTVLEEILSPTGSTTNSNDEYTLYWIEENKNDIALIAQEDSEITVMNTNSSITANLSENTKGSFLVDGSKNSVVIDSVDNFCDITFTNVNDADEVISVSLNGSTDGIVTVEQNDTGLEVSGIANGSVTLSVEDEVVAIQNITTNENYDTKITYDINSKNDHLEVEYTHTCADKNLDGVCDICDAGSTKNCSCMCHSNSFVQFIHKVLCFFYKLFGMNDYRYCDCGKAHW